MPLIMRKTCYLCSTVQEVQIENVANMAEQTLTGMLGHVCKGGRELYHTPYEMKLTGPVPWCAECGNQKGVKGRCPQCGAAQQIAK